MKKYKKDFSNKDFADYHIKRHKKIIEKLGYDHAKKIASMGFKRGKILDADCGFGGMDIVLAKRIPGCEIIGINKGGGLIKINPKI
jgi:tRNA1(Val) A37 N6-methylase TrmN6